jgi:hypothetical protein
MSRKFLARTINGLTSLPPPTDIFAGKSLTFPKERVVLGAYICPYVVVKSAGIFCNTSFPCLIPFPVEDNHNASPLKGYGSTLCKYLSIPHSSRLPGSSPKNKFPSELSAVPPVNCSGSGLCKSLLYLRVSPLNNNLGSPVSQTAALPFPFNSIARLYKLFAISSSVIPVWPTSPYRSLASGTSF